MGLLGDLFELGGIVLEGTFESTKEVVSLPFVIAHSVVELGQDIGENVQQGIDNTIHGRSDSIRTSYDVRDEADKIVKEGESRLRDARIDVQDIWDRTEEKARELYDLRAKVCQSLDQRLNNSTALMPSYYECSLPCPNMPSIDSFSFNFGTYVGSASMRMEAAEEYLVKAKRYRSEVDLAIAQLRDVQRMLRRTRNCQDEEKAMLSHLQASLAAQTSETLESSREILREITELCTQKVSDNTNSSYSDLVRRVNQLNHF